MTEKEGCADQQTTPSPEGKRPTCLGAPWSASQAHRTAGQEGLLKKPVPSALRSCYKASFKGFVGAGSTVAPSTVNAPSTGAGEMPLDGRLSAKLWGN